MPPGVGKSDDDVTPCPAAGMSIDALSRCQQYRTPSSERRRSYGRTKLFPCHERTLRGTGPRGHGAGTGDANAINAKAKAERSQAQASEQ